MAATKSLHDVLAWERSRHPQMAPRDVQKLIYQSVFGGDHALVERDRLAAGVQLEWDSLDGLPGDEPLLQSIDPEGRVVRIHLAPARASGIEPEALVDILWAQPRRGGTREAYDRRWRDVIELATEGEIDFEASALAALGFPSDLPHHSLSYGPTSYRILNDLADSRTRAWLESHGALDQG